MNLAFEYERKAGKLRDKAIRNQIMIISGWKPKSPERRNEMFEKAGVIDPWSTIEAVTE